MKPITEFLIFIASGLLSLAIMTPIFAVLIIVSI